MTEQLTTIVVAALGFLGTLAGLYFAHRQWKVSREDGSRAPVAEARRLAYSELWKRVEELHADLMVTQLPEKTVRQKTADVNRFIMTNEVYLKDGHREIVNDYLDEFREATRQVHAQGNRADKERMSQTSLRSSEAAVIQRLIRKRQELLNVIRKELDASR